MQCAASTMLINRINGLTGPSTEGSVDCDAQSSKERE